MNISRGWGLFAFFAIFFCVHTQLLAAGPSISADPQSQYVNLGAPLTLSVTATASGAITYQWRFNSTNLAGETAATLNYAHVQQSDAGSYDVIVTSGGISVTSTPAIVTVLVPPTFPGLQTSYALVKNGYQSIFASVSGSSPMTYQWEKNGTDIPGATSWYLFFGPITASSAGTYKIKATNPAGSATSDPIVVTVVDELIITTQPTDVSINPGASATFSISASGPGTIHYQWTHNYSYISGATNSSLTVTNATSADAGIYYCIVNNDYQSGIASNLVTLTVKAAPVITQQPMGAAFTTGGYYQLYVEAQGSGTLTYQWKKNGVALPQGGTGYYGQDSSNLSFNPALPDAGGTYSCDVTNPYGTTTSNDAVVTVTANVNGPTITTQPSSVSVSVGAPTSFSVSATSALGGPLTYQWRKNGVNISAANSSTFVIASASSSDAADYSVAVTNNWATVNSSPATLTVLSSTPSAPTISQQPSSQTAATGANVTFTVTATGNPSLTYSWRKNGSNISGANSSSLTLNNVQASDSGTYSVVVINTAGSVVSADATLSVLGHTRLINLSTRAQVGTDANVLIAGFIINGTTPKQMLIRAVGPTLSKFNVDGVLQNPYIKVVSNGETIATNDDWGVSSNLADLVAAHTTTGAFPLQDGGKDSALLLNLKPGAYTAVISGANNSTGVALAELYEVDGNTPNQLVNISSRAFVGTGSQVLISGLIVKGDQPQKFLIRGVGPGLTQFGLTNVLANPRIEVVDASSKTVATNDDWGVNDNLAETKSVSSALNVFALADGSKDAAMVVNLNPGTYTVLVRGANDTTGVALVEVYLVP